MGAEADLLDALRSRDRDARSRAESELYREYLPRVRGLLSRVVGSGPELDDAVQEAFIDVFRGVPRFEGRSGLGTWIYRVALRRGWKHASKRETTRKRTVEGEAVMANTPARTSGPRKELEAREMARRLEIALKQLPYEFRSVIALSGLEGFTPTEVAETLGIPVGTVHSRLSRARAKLKELLELDRAPPEGPPS